MCLVKYIQEKKQNKEKVTEYIITKIIFSLFYLG